MAVSQTLADLGVTLPEVVPPVAAYLPAVVHGDLIYTSGQLPMTGGALPATGKVGGAVSADDAKGYARQSALNAIAAAAAAVGGVDRLTGVVKVVGFVASTPDFTGQPGVINGASELLGQVFGEAGRHARSAVAAPVLPLDSPVEVEVIFSYV
ncbi:RidA family protein [Microbacterium kribbense]|uniref:RidA family protein n=1 Tax=Microbacterium kribbense TaxID=433645 RepID=A0ABP7GF18_9MICO